MLKKSAIVLTSCNGIQRIYLTAVPASKTSSISTRKSVTRSNKQQCRSYAMVSDGYSRNHHESVPWPEVTTINRIPTPYQIFAQKKGSPYSKKRFYELVKMYHPDKHNGNDIDGIPYATKLERYRLVVAANDILSDPVKRGAYDLYGAGWNGQPDVLKYEDGAEGTKDWGTSRGWGSTSNGPSQNATWEDWERWYGKDSKSKQEPLYFSNTAFVSLIVTLAALGGIAQATRVGAHSLDFLAQRDALHDEMSKDLMRRRRDSGGFGSREERIHSFLRQRDPMAYDITGPQQPPRLLLSAPDTCSSDDISRKSMSEYDHAEEPRKDGCESIDRSGET